MQTKSVSCYSKSLYISYYLILVLSTISLISLVLYPSVVFRIKLHGWMELPCPCPWSLSINTSSSAIPEGLLSRWILPGTLSKEMRSPCCAQFFPITKYRYPIVRWCSMHHLSPRSAREGEEAETMDSGYNQEKTSLTSPPFTCATARRSGGWRCLETRYMQIRSNKIHRNPRNHHWL